uniref:Uncharacterized protein n=1 Tax=Panagrolaimus sp. ES5 TaxID=591445 RepID=A0AC34FY20_9BILA
MLKFEIDRNGIFTLTFKRIGKNIDFFRPPKSLSFQNKRILKIPSKLFEYNKGLNAVGIDLGTVECCAFVIRRNGPEGVILDPVTNNRNLQSYVDINEINEPCGQLIVNRMETKSKFSAFDVKRLIGKELHEIEIDPLWPYKVINYCEQIYLLFDGDNDPCPYVKSSVEIT